MRRGASHTVHLTLREAAREGVEKLLLMNVLCFDSFEKLFFLRLFLNAVFVSCAEMFFHAKFRL